MWNDLRVYLRALAKHWGIIVSGGALATLQLGWAFVQGPILGTYVISVSMVLLLVLACFEVWRDQNRQLREFTEAAVPLLRVDDPAGIYTEVRRLTRRISAAEMFYAQGSSPVVSQEIHIIDGRFVLVRLINDPAKPLPSSVATGVSAKIYFFDESGAELFHIDGRWGDTEQPSNRPPLASRFDLLQVDIGIGLTRELDILFKDPAEDECYAFNNDSYGGDGFKPERFRLRGGKFHVEVRVRGVNIDQSFRFDVVNPGRGKNLEIVRPTGYVSKSHA